MTQAFSALGRETFITDARWTADGWLEADPVLLNPRAGEFVFSDTFGGSSGSSGSDGSGGSGGSSLGLEWIGVRRYPSEFASLTARPGHVVLTGDGSSLDDLRPAFLGYRQQHPWASVSVQVDAGSDGLGGLGVRYDELHHYEIEVSGRTITARAAVAGIRQEWSVGIAPESRSSPASPVTLLLDFVESTGAGMLPNLSSDTVVLSATTADGEHHELARIDGRYLSQETAASFTGRVLGPYATRGEVAFADFRYAGRD
jgi:xylan 1,4-beta-xylosidase